MKKDGTALAADAYTLGTLTGKEFTIAFNESADLEGRNEIVVEIQKSGYVINSGNTIEVGNTLIKSVKETLNPGDSQTWYLNLTGNGTYKDRDIIKGDFIFEGNSLNFLEGATFTRTSATQVKIQLLEAPFPATYTVTVKAQVQEQQAAGLNIVPIY